MPSPFQLHCSTWSRGCGSEMCSRAKRVCLYRGEVPCRILFIGEAPGESEDAQGRPFVGPAGHLLNHVIRRAIPHQREDVPGSSPRFIPSISYGITNLVGCMPKDEDGRKPEDHSPPPEQVRQCSGRLQEVVSLARPELIVCVGNEARDWLDDRWKHAISLPVKVPMESITHPSAILRMKVVQKGFEVRRCVITIQRAIEEYLK